MSLENPLVNAQEQFKGEETLLNAQAEYPEKFAFLKSVTESAGIKTREQK